MVANFEIPKGQARPQRRADAQMARLNPHPGFPLSSPTLEDLTALKPRPGPDRLAPNNPFLPSNPFTSSSSDEDSGSSSGQDEFHLERYSQDAKNRAQIPQSRRTRSVRRQQNSPISKPGRRPRPGLNIVTNFSQQATRSHTDGLIIDKVHSQRPRLGPRYATSIVSAKAEHIGGATTGIVLDQEDISVNVGVHHHHENRSRALDRSATSSGMGTSSRWLELRAPQKKSASTTDDTQSMRSAAMAPPTIENAASIHTKGRTVMEYSPEARSIVIGLSVPEDEAEAHRATNGGDSALSGPTPDTPAIVVTPAEETGFWRSQFAGASRPPSSIYSAFPRHEAQPSKYSTPPVPKIPPALASLSNPDPVTAGAVITGALSSPHQHYAQESEAENEKEASLADNAPRSSSESQHPILPPEPGSARPRSQGWWNLMLSPMLSRKGTIVDKGGTKTVEVPPLPSGLIAPETPNTIFVSPGSSGSPDTPRRLGLASARASVWSRWTSWERERGGTRLANGDVKDGQHESYENGKHVLSAPVAVPNGEGLAAEYYHACAVEQLTGAHYFYCQNHSCAEGLPELQSVFDAKSVQNPSTATESADRSVEQSVADNSVPSVQKAKVKGDMTIQTEPKQLSPNVQQAATPAPTKTVPVDMQDVPKESISKASPEQADAESIQPPAADSAPQSVGMQYHKIATIVRAHVDPPVVMSPGPISPAMQQNMASQGAVPMTEILQHPGPASSRQQTHTSKEPSIPSPAQPAITVHNYTNHTDRSPFRTFPAAMEARSDGATSRPSSVRQPSSPGRGGNEGRKRPAPETAQKPSILSKLTGLFRRKMPTGEGNTMGKKRQWTLIVSVPLFLIVVTCLLLAVLLTRTGDSTPVQSQWLNLTGYPPIPTGISTIARPDAVKEQSQCVAPTTLWSCALPKESQAEIAPNNPDQPNFRFEILFRNGTVAANMTIPVDSLSRGSSGVQKRATDPFTNDMFEPNPAPPSRADQIFMGNTTDNITQPFEGERTPFFITYIPVFPVDPSNVTSSNASDSRLLARQTTNSSDAIPAPDVLDDGSAAPANLLPTSPYPTSQPIKLYNRGQVDEHYGFYMYYDKAIFLKSTAAINVSEFSNNAGIDPDDEDGGATRDQSRLRCTFSQTRFLVRMWTNPAFGATLLSPTSGTNSTNGTANSATNFERPGSFPYPTTLTLDRHGGNINKKAVYCYRVDDLQVIQTDVKSIVPEIRGIGGALINPAPPLVNGSIDAGTDGFDQDAGGIDGGTGGCECVWQNWN
ncbi:hypothetical protein A1O1_05504 [Capronia coronata CBS 617.96]|uniref:Glycoprotease family protein n=1 Tax=Capronia coronata CBS 617.96 TaxID=1182541 RepID=W9Z237_9EURO|nr:uncharacterized protein A1O1_05504 [Capronia coronata CBS 617.96]EXJ88574.1 hypothetical protein A1O1_05504 [Capronia coronata CBS 617.96]